MPKDGELRCLSHPNRVICFSDTFTPKIDYLKLLTLGETLYEARNPRYYKRHSLIPNIPGQKYTIGKLFISREEQGEFILCQKDGIGNSHCEIHCDEAGNFWVVPNYPTFVNDEPLLQKQELKFGDYLFLIQDSNGIFLKENYVKFLFMEREFNTDLFLRQGHNLTVSNPILCSGEQQIEFIHQNNEIVLSKIMAFLPHSQLKSCRFISRSFNSTAKRILSKRSTATLKFYIGSGKNQSLCFFQYLNEMRNMQLQSFKLHFDMFDRNNPNIMREKLIIDLSMFLENVQINELKLNTDLDASMMTKVFLLIFKKFGKTLKNLELSRAFLPADENDVFPNFPSLTTLSFKYLQGWVQGNDEQKLAEWTCKFIRNCPNVRKLKLALYDMYLPWPKVFMEKLSEFKSLEEIEMDEVSNRDLEHLLNITRPLKALILGEILTFEDHDFIKFEELLKKHAESLVTLKFTLFPGYWRIMSVGIKILRLPSFPKLKSLSIEQQLVPGRTEFSFEFFDGKEIDYERDFPVLEKLELVATNKYNGSTSGEYSDEEDDGECWEGAFKQFLRTGAICKSLRELKVANINDMEKMIEIFPNVQSFRN